VALCAKPITPIDHSTIAGGSMFPIFGPPFSCRCRSHPCCASPVVGNLLYHPARQVQDSAVAPSPVLYISPPRSPEGDESTFSACSVALRADRSGPSEPHCRWITGMQQPLEPSAPFRRVSRPVRATSDQGRIPSHERSLMCFL